MSKKEGYIPTEKDGPLPVKQAKVRAKESTVGERQKLKVGELVERFCPVCGVERGHVVASVTKRGQIARLACPACGTRSSLLKRSATTSGSRADTKTGAPYDPKRTYRRGQLMLHPAFRMGEVTVDIEPQQTDAYFEEHMHPLIFESSEVVEGVDESSLTEYVNRCLANIDLARQRMSNDQIEIDRLREETRSLISDLMVA